MENEFTGPDNNEQPHNKQKTRKGIWALLGALLLLLSKFKFIIFFMLGKLKFLLVFLKLAKFLTTFGSMLLMVWVYANFYGWIFAVGFALLIFVHEMGHFLTAKYVGLNVSAPIFIPFMGAFITMKDHPADAVTEAKVAVGGPLVGSFGAFLCAAMYSLSGQDFWLALAYSGFMINLFNLIPFHPLDGGRIVSAISPKMWLVGIPLIVMAAFKFFNPILFLLLILGLTQIYRQWKSPNQEYYNTPLTTRAVFAGLYFGLLIILGSSMKLILDYHSALLNG